MRRVAALLAIAASPALATPASLDFDRVFSARGEPASLHAVVAYRAGGAAHRMELWRDAARIARRTDGVLASYAARAPDGVGYRLTMLDSRRRIRTDIDRTNLYRIGNFTDWFDLAHGLRHPKGAYTLIALAAARHPTAISPCRWYALTQQGHTTAICWSETSRLPLLITAGDGDPVWRVLSLDTRAVPAARFAIDDRGYVRNDADQDIAAD